MSESEHRGSESEQLASNEHNGREVEISLVDAWEILRRQKYIVLGVAVFTTICALIYALQITPAYKVEAVFLPPKEGDIQLLNVYMGSSAGVQEVPASKGASKASSMVLNVPTVFARFRKNLASSRVRRVVFDEMFPSASEDSKNASTNMSFNRLNKKMRIKARKSGISLYPVPIVTLEIRGEDPELIANFANRVGREAERVAAEEVVSDLRAAISVKINNLKMKIDALREQAKKKRLDEIELLTIKDALEREKLNSTIAVLREHAKKERLRRIVRLKDAADIAHKLGIKDPITYQLNKINEKSSNETRLLAGLTAETELYKRGFEALEAEIESLLKRDNDDPYIADLGKIQSELMLLKHNPQIEHLRNRKSDDLYIQSFREIEKELRLLESIKVDKTMFKTARVDRAAFPPKQHIKPKQMLIIVLGLVLGIVLGIYSAFMFREFNKL